MSDKLYFINQIEPSAGFSGRIMMAIFREDERLTRKRGLLSILASALSALAFFAAGAWLYRDAVNSGFVQAASFAFSDSSLFAAYWKEFLSTMLETLPFVSLVALLASALAALVSAKFLLEARRHRALFTNAAPRITSMHAHA